MTKQQRSFHDRVGRFGAQTAARSDQPALLRVLPFICGTMLGLCGFALILMRGLPDLGGLAALDAQVATALPIIAPYTVYLFIAVLLGVLFLLRRIIFRSGALIGLVLGAILWVPFGGHILTALPQLAQSAPSIRANLDQLVGGVPAGPQIREMAESSFPVRAVN